MHGAEIIIDSRDVLDRTEKTVVGTVFESSTADVVKDESSLRILDENCKTSFTYDDRVNVPNQVHISQQRDYNGGNSKDKAASFYYDERDDVSQLSAVDELELQAVIDDDQSLRSATTTDYDNSLSTPLDLTNARSAVARNSNKRSQVAYDDGRIGLRGDTKPKNVVYTNSNHARRPFCSTVGRTCIGNSYGWVNRHIDSNGRSHHSSAKVEPVGPSVFDRLHCLSNKKDLEGKKRRKEIANKQRENYLHRTGGMCKQVKKVSAMRGSKFYYEGMIHLLEKERKASTNAETATENFITRLNVSQISEYACMLRKISS